MGAYFYFQYPGIAALIGGLTAGLLFGLFMAWNQQRGEERLRSRGLNADDMRPFQEKSVRLLLTPEAAMERARSALTSIRQLNTDSVQVTTNRIVATTGMTWQSFGERITVEVRPEEAGSLVCISSRPKVRTTVADSGKGRENVEVFAKALQA